MGSPYALAGLFSLLFCVFMYMIFVPKSTRSFSDSQNKFHGNRILSLVSNIGDDIFAAMPAFVDDRDVRTEHPRVESLLIRAGNPWNVTAREFVALQYIGLFLGVVSGFILWLALKGQVGLPWFVYVGFTSVLGYKIPSMKYNDQAKQRDLDFRRQLPEALDLMTISLAGGTSFAQSLRDVIPTMNDGILKAEFKNMVSIIDAGGTLDEALDSFANRAPNDSIITFIRSVQSAQESNAPMGEILSSRAKASRDEFFALVHEKAAQLESKMWMVLAPTLLPAVIVIVVSPSINSMLQTLT